MKLEADFEVGLKEFNGETDHVHLNKALRSSYFSPRIAGCSLMYLIVFFRDYREVKEGWGD